MIFQLGVAGLYWVRLDTPVQLQGEWGIEQLLSATSSWIQDTEMNYGPFRLESFIIKFNFVNVSSQEELSYLTWVTINAIVC